MKIDELEIKEAIKKYNEAENLKAQYFNELNNLVFDYTVSNYKHQYIYLFQYFGNEISGVNIYSPSNKILIKNISLDE